MEKLRALLLWIYQNWHTVMMWIFLATFVVKMDNDFKDASFYAVLAILHAIFAVEQKIKK